MIPPRRHPVFVCAVWLAAASCPAAAELPAATADPWIEMRSPRFIVYSNAGEGVARRAARHLERLADAMQRTTRGLAVDSHREVRVYVFKDPASFRPYAGLPDDEHSVTAGFHVTGPDAEYVAYYEQPGDESLRFAAHEYTHAVLSRSFGPLPTWLNEGLAEYFSTFQAKGRSAQIGRAVPEHVAWLRSHVLSLDYILRLSSNNPDYEQGERRATIYAESWGLVHSLIMSREASPSRFDALIGEVARGTESMRAVRAIYGPNAPDSLEGALRQMAARSSLPYFDWTFEEDYEAVQVKTRVLSRGPMLVALGELLANGRDALHPLAEEHLRSAWAVDSGLSVAAARLGELFGRHGDCDAADPWFRAVERHPAADPRACAIAGAALAACGRPTNEAPRWPAPGSTTATLRGRALLALALEREPDRSEWLAAYGLTFLDDTTGFDDGMGALIMAQAAWPRRSDIQGGLSVLNLRGGNRGAAIAMYQRIPTGADSRMWRSHSGWLIGREMSDAIQRLAREGRVAEAESLLVRLRRDVHEPGVSDHCDRLEEQLRDFRERVEGR